MSALMSFLGGSAFRMLWGEAASYMTRKQEHSQAKEQMALADEQQENAHKRAMEALELRSKLGLSQETVQQELALQTRSLEIWGEASKATYQPSGIAWIDGWNQAIRPAAATLALLAMVVEIFLVGALSEWHHEVFSAALGLFLADRSLTKRGK